MSRTTSPVSVIWTYTNAMLKNTLVARNKGGRTNVVPRHASAVQNAQGVADEVVYVLEVHDPRVVVVLPREERRERVRGVHVRERVRVRVPAPEAQVEPADARVVVVDDDDLLVVRPELDVVCAESHSAVSERIPSTVVLAWLMCTIRLTYLCCRCGRGGACTRC